MTFDNEIAPGAIQYELNPNPSPAQLEVRDLRERASVVMHMLLHKPKPAETFHGRIKNALMPDSVQSPKVYMHNRHNNASDFGWYWLERGTSESAPAVRLYLQEANIDTARRDVTEYKIPVVTYGTRDIAFGFSRHPAQDEEDLSVERQLELAQGTFEVLKMILLVQETKRIHLAASA